jgi:hypothetical protein
MVDKEKTAQDKIRKLEEAIAKKKALLVRVKGNISQKERKARTRKLIEIGGLADIAGLTDSHHGFLLGVLLKARDISPTSDKYQELKDKGDSVLKEREKARNKKNG